MTDETKRLLLQMSAGIVIWNLLLAAAGYLLAPSLGWSGSSMILGAVCGALLAEGMLVHMAVITEKAIGSCDEAYANKTTLIHSILRRLVFFVILVLILWKVPQVNALAVVLGVMGLKAGAYLQPVLFRKPDEAGPAKENGIIEDADAEEKSGGQGTSRIFPEEGSTAAPGFNGRNYTEGKEE